MASLRLALFLLAVCRCCPDVLGDIASTWGGCNCRWGTWEAWSDCDSTCFGSRQRSRKVWHTDKPGCTEFTHCASNDMGWDLDVCNDVCHNGGSHTSTMWVPCLCQPANYGKCCENTVDCGNPGDVEHGSVTFSLTTYGGTATYFCDEHYNVTGADPSRTCQSNAVWSGAEPRCAFVNACGSGPCQNGATCQNGLDEYTCICSVGWTGENCEHDILPPEMNNCPDDMQVNVTERTQTLKWTEPSFHDSRGHEVKVTGNYNSPKFEFPWGDFTVQYIATKPYNGLKTECTFTIHVRPTPCRELNVPLNGVRLCNGWAKDYGMFCMLACRTNFTISTATSYSQWYVCGASGNWMAAAPMPDCEVEVNSPADAIVYHPEYTQQAFSSCDGDDVTGMQQLYLTRMESGGFASFCTAHGDSCNAKNVDLRCDF